MRYPILHYRTGNVYLDHLEGLDEDAVLDEFYTSKRLHRAVKRRTYQVCRTVVNQFYRRLKYVDHEDIACYEAYLLRFLLNFERFIRREMQYINKLHDFDNAKPIRGIAPPEAPRAPAAYCAYCDMLQDFQRLERIVFALEEKLRLWMYFLYKKGDIPEECKRWMDPRSVCVVKKDGSYDWPRQPEAVSDILGWVIEDEMECDILKFKDDSEFCEN
jgi:hypothetical protein